MIINKIDLRMFDGAGAGGAGASGTGAGTAGEAGTADASTTSADTGDKVVYKPKHKKGGKLDSVVYGTQTDPDAGDQTARSGEGNADAGKAKEQTAPEMSADDKFNELIKGDYKEQYQNSVQQIINKRFKDTKNLEAQLGAYAPLMDMLSQKYGVDASDIQGLTNAIESDDSTWEQQAYENDMDVEQYKAFKKLEMQNAKLLREQQARQGQEQAMRQLNEWNQQAEELKKTFSGFDLNEEANNPQFMALLKNHVPVEHAYKVVHLNDILDTQAETVAKQAEKNVTDNIRAKGKRPAENGMVSQSGFTYKSDVHQLTKADRAEIAKRVARGEKITFR